MRLIDYCPLMICIAEIEKKRRRALGKSKIGGPWQMKHMDGKEMSSEDFHGKWVRRFQPPLTPIQVMIYFGFTHCPDICPDEIEKMIAVVSKLRQVPKTANIEPLFMTVDPLRDSAEAVKKYCKGRNAFAAVHTHCTHLQTSARCCRASRARRSRWRRCAAHSACTTARGRRTSRRTTS